MAESGTPNSLSPQMSELVEDAVGSWCGHIVGHFWLIMQEWALKKFRAQIWIFQFEHFRCLSDILVRSCTNEAKYSYWIFLKGLCWVSGYWITHCVPCLGFFCFFIVCPIVPSIFGAICCVIFQIYIIIFI